MNLRADRHDRGTYQLVPRLKTSRLLGLFTPRMGWLNPPRSSEITELGHSISAMLSLIREKWSVRRFRRPVLDTSRSFKSMLLPRALVIFSASKVSLRPVDLVEQSSEGFTRKVRRVFGPLETVLQDLQSSGKVNLLPHGWVDKSKTTKNRSNTLHPTEIVASLVPTKFSGLCPFRHEWLAKISLVKPRKPPTMSRVALRYSSTKKTGARTFFKKLQQIDGITHVCNLLRASGVKKRGRGRNKIIQQQSNIRLSRWRHSTRFLSSVACAGRVRIPRWGGTK